MSDRVESVVVDDVSPCQVIFEGGASKNPNVTYNYSDGYMYIAMTNM